jgi:hypothetical protein
MVKFALNFGVKSALSRQFYQTFSKLTHHAMRFFRIIDYESI